MFGWRATNRAKPPPLTGVERVAKTARRREEARLCTARRRSGETEGQAASRRGSYQERICLTIRKRPFFFWSQQKLKAEQSFSMGLSVGWVIDREARKLSGATGAKRQRRAEPQERSDNVEQSHKSEATKLSRARMPEQHRAGQLVLHNMTRFHHLIVPNLVLFKSWVH